MTQQIKLQQGGWNISLPFFNKQSLVAEFRNIHEIYAAVANKSSMPFRLLKPFNYCIKNNDGSQIIEEGELFFKKGKLEADFIAIK